MLAITLLIGLTNFSLGFALAMWFRGMILLPGPVGLWHARPALSGERDASMPDVASATVGLETSPDVASAEVAEVSPPTISRDCIDRLKKEGLEPETFLESLLWLARVELPAGREQLVTADEDCRVQGDAMCSADPVRDVCDSWGKKLAGWAGMILESNKDEASHGIAEQFEEMLLDQSYQLQSISDQIATSTQRGAGEGQLHGRLSEIESLLEVFNAIRDDADRMLAELLHDEHRLDTVPESHCKNDESEMLNRLGIDVLFGQWQEESAGRLRLASGVMLDIDRAAKLNERLGVGAADSIIAALGEMLRDDVRKERGFDRVARFSGQAYFLFLGDTASDNAVSGAERIRQTIEATSFQLGVEDVELTVCCAVAEIERYESASDFYARLLDTIKEGKRAGGNRTSVFKEGGAKIAELPQYKVKGRVIEVLDQPQSPSKSNPDP